MTAEVILYTGREYANGEHPIMLKLTHKGARKFKTISKGLTAKKTEWNNRKNTLKAVKESDPGYNRYLEMISVINDTRSKYADEIKILASRKQEISIENLIKRVENPIEHMTVLTYFDRVINQEGGGKYGNGRTFKNTFDRVKEFTKGQDVEFYNIDLRWLNDWRDYMKSSRDTISDATLSIYFRSLRTVFNRAIGEGYCDLKDYPFGKKNEKVKFTISQFKATPNKRAISQKDLQKIKDIDLSNVDAITRKDKFGKAIRPIYMDDLLNAQMIFMFSYYSAGMNYNDIAKLKWSEVNLDEGIITYIRTKTKKKLSTFIHPYNMNILRTQELITGEDADGYVFNVLHKAVQTTDDKINGKVHREMRLVNDALKEIQKRLKIKTDLTTYVARHSAITHMIQNGVALNVVKETVGHSNIDTTMQYVALAKQNEIANAVNSLS